MICEIYAKCQLYLQLIFGNIIQSIMHSQGKYTEENLNKQKNGYIEVVMAKLEYNKHYFETTNPHIYGNSELREPQIPIYMVIANYENHKYRDIIKYMSILL